MPVFLLAMMFAGFGLVRPTWAVEAHYEVYAAGLNVLELDANFDIVPDRYWVTLDYRTVGAFGLFSRSRQRTVVQGRLVDGRALPREFVSSGVLRGEPRATRIDYGSGQPVVVQLVPPNKAEREVVPAGRQAGTVDTVSAMAALIARVNSTGRCDGEAMTFDGRRLALLQARTSGAQALSATGRSSFAGPTLRCEFTGTQIGGFMLDEDRASLAKPQHGSAWFAAVSPGGPMIPVRVAFRTRFFGEATMYLVSR